MPPPYSAVGRCIYCGATEGLTDEHIIQESLGGRDVLPASSCPSCCKETSAFEGRVAGKMLIDVRAIFGWTSKKRKRPTHLEVSTKEGPRTISLEDHPPAIVLAMFEPPKILVGSSAEAGKMVMVGIQSYAAPEFKEKLEKFGKDGFRFSPFEIGSLSRTLAKIAHAYSVAELGTDGFEPLLPDLILGKSDHLADYVGSGPLPEGQPATEQLHRVTHEWNGDLLLVRVGLYSKFGLSPYWVVSGRRKVVK